MTKARHGMAAQLRDFSYAWAEFLRAIARMFTYMALRIDARAWAQEDDEYWLRDSDDERRP